MKIIKLNASVVSAYNNIKVDISYALSELLGYVDYDYSQIITSGPMTQTDTVVCQISDQVYEELADKFDNASSIDAVAEIMLWANFFTGGHL